MPRGVKNEVDPSVTDEDVIKAIKALSTGRRTLPRDEWNQRKPPGYPTTGQIRLRTGQTWGNFLRAHGLKPKIGRRQGRSKFTHDKRYYRRRMRELCPDGGMGLRRDEWDDVRDPDKGELSSTSVGDLFGGWPAFLTECGLDSPPHGAKDRVMARREEEEEAIFLEMVGDVDRSELLRAKPLRLVAGGVVGKRRTWDPVRRSWYEVSVRLGGRFE